MKCWEVLEWLQKKAASQGFSSMKLVLAQRSGNRIVTNLSESFKEGYGSKRAVLPMTVNSGGICIIHRLEIRFCTK
jgi:hypothetical protein